MGTMGKGTDKGGSREGGGGGEEGGKMGGGGGETHALMPAAASALCEVDHLIPLSDLPSDPLSPNLPVSR